MQLNADKPHRIFAEVAEEEALRQFESAMQQAFVVRGALMPDVHVGYSLPIGAVVATKDVVVPAWVGYDIGCGMCALPTTYSAPRVRQKAQEIFEKIYKAIPVGSAHNTQNTPWKEERHLARSQTLKSIFAKDGLRQLGSLGSGNHFAEIGVDEKERVWVVIHSGSRGIGHAVATHHMRLASGGHKAREGHFGFEVHGVQGKDYLMDLNFCLSFALENRREMMRRIVAVLDSLLVGEANWAELINRNHNHVDKKEGLWIHRKGATHAEEGMLGVIPGNMRDGSFIVRGKGNPESLWSSSHGAGRVLGRQAAKRSLELKSFADTMHGIVAKISNGTLDESPFAYKNIFEVMKQQQDMVDIVAHVRPILNMKA